MQNIKDYINMLWLLLDLINRDLSNNIVNDI